MTHRINPWSGRPRKATHDDKDSTEEVTKTVYKKHFQKRRKSILTKPMASLRSERKRENSLGNGVEHEN